MDSSLTPPDKPFDLETIEPPTRDEFIEFSKKMEVLAFGMYKESGMWTDRARNVSNIAHKLMRYADGYYR